MDIFICFLHRCFACLLFSRILITGAGAAHSGTLSSICAFLSLRCLSSRESLPLHDVVSHARRSVQLGDESPDEEMAQVLLVLILCEIVVLQQEKTAEKGAERPGDGDHRQESRHHCLWRDRLPHVYKQREDNHPESSSKNDDVVQPVVPQLLVHLAVDLGTGHGIKNDGTDPGSDVSKESKDILGIRFILADREAHKIGNLALGFHIPKLVGEIAGCEGLSGRIEDLLRHSSLSKAVNQLVLIRPLLFNTCCLGYSQTATCIREHCRNTCYHISTLPLQIVHSLFSSPPSLITRGPTRGSRVVVPRDGPESTVPRLSTVSLEVQHPPPMPMEAHARHNVRVAKRGPKLQMRGW